MDNLNKITHTRVGDNIHYYINGKEDRGVVVKMNNAYVTVVKSDGNLHEIHINDTFFIKDIITNKTWNDMSFEERTEELQKAHAFSPRFLSKTWEELPKELKDVLSKSDVEESTHGQIGGNRAGVSTKTPFDADEDYEGESDDDKKEEFKHEHQKKPSVDKNNGIEESHKEEDSMQEDWRKTGGSDDKNKNYINKYQQGGKFVNNPSVGSGTSASQMADTYGGKKVKPAVSTDQTEYRSTSGKLLGRGAEGKKLQEEDLNKATWQNWLEKKKYDYETAEENQKEIFAKRDKKRESDKKIYGTLGSVTPKKTVKIQKTWEKWLEKFTGGDLGEKPKNTTVEEPNSTLQRGLGNRATSKPNDVSSALNNLSNHLGEQNKRLTESGNKMREFGSNKKPRSVGLRERQIDHTNSVQDNIKRREGQDPSGQRGKEPSYRQQRGKKPSYRQQRDHDRGNNQSTADRFQNKSYGKPLYGVSSLEKEGDGAGNSGINSLESTGVYNVRYSDKKGRYKDQERDQ